MNLALRIRNSRDQKYVVPYQKRQQYAIKKKKDEAKTSLELIDPVRKRYLMNLALKKKNS